MFFPKHVPIDSGGKISTDLKKEKLLYYPPINVEFANK
jgi:hypothetical protein